MSARDGGDLGAAHLLTSVGTAVTPASRHSPFLDSRSDQMNLSPEPDVLIPPRSLPSALTTAPASSTSESATAEESETTIAAPYGTRSRQRTDGSRPNYAEDKDTEVDTEMNGTNSKAISARKNGGVIESLPTETLWEVPTRRGFSAINGVTKSATVNGQLAKESIPGTSIFTANPAAATTSKKRRHPGTSVTTTTITNPCVTARPKGSTGTHSRLLPETNMMTFERCGGYLDANRQLKSDDETTLSVNGEALSFLRN